MTDRMTKTKQVKEHLVNHGSIDSWTAIQDYGVTRLASIICILRKNGWDIDTEDVTTKDRNGNTCTFAKYVFHGMLGE